MVDRITLSRRPVLNLSTLPPLEVTEEANFQEIYTQILAEFIALSPDYTEFTEADPIIKVIQSFAYREYVWRQLLNEAASSGFLAFATAGNLDNLGSFYDVVRLVGENDDDLRTRIQLTIRGTSAAGSRTHYEQWARFCG